MQITMSQKQPSTPTPAQQPNTRVQEKPPKVNTGTVGKSTDFPPPPKKQQGQKRD